MRRTPYTRSFLPTSLYFAAVIFTLHAKLLRNNVKYTSHDRI